MSDPEGTATTPKKDARSRMREAAWTLVQRGQRPTQRSVLDLVGGGSPNTANEVLRAFWEELGERLQRPPLPGPIVQAAEELWTQAVAEAQRTQQRYREDSDRQVEETRAVAAKAKAQQVAAEQALIEAQRKIEELRERVNTLTGDLASTTTRLEDADGRADGAQHQVSELTRQLAEKERIREEMLEAERQRSRLATDAMQGQIDQITARTESQARQIQTLETEARVREDAHTQQVHTLQARIEDIRAQLDARAEEQTASLQEIAALRNALAASDRVRQDTELESARLKAQLEMSERERIAIKHHASTLEGERGEFKAQLEACRDRVVALEAALTTAETREAGLATRLSEAEARIRDLTGEAQDDR